MAVLDVRCACIQYVAGYIISKMYRKSKVAAKQTAERAELQSLLLSMKSMDDNEYIDSLIKKTNLINYFLCRQAPYIICING